MFYNFGKPAKTIIYIILCVSLLLVLFPLVYAFLGSFKSTTEFLTGGTKLLPKEWIWQNYVTAWNVSNFGRYMLNSLVLSGSAILGTLVICSLSGYVFARTEFFGKKLLLAMLVGTMFVSGSVTLFPIFMLSNRLGITNSVLGTALVLVATGQQTYCFIIMGFVSNVPKELDEAARLDGCGFFRIYWNVILPIIKPILATVTILKLRDAWNAYMLPLAFTLGKPHLRPLTVGVVMLKEQGEGISSWNLMIAGTVMSLIPMIIIYIFMNKQFISGVTDGSVKG